MTRGHRKAEAAETPEPSFARRHRPISSRNTLGLVVLLLALAAAACFESTIATSPPKSSASAAATQRPTASPVPTPTTPPGFSITGWMTTSRSGQTATLLANGTVLIAGGSTVAGISDAELYDPNAGTFSPTNPPAVIPSSHTATLLSDGRVLIAGGFGTTSPNSSEIPDGQSGYEQGWRDNYFDPMRDYFSSLDADARPCAETCCHYPLRSGGQVSMTCRRIANSPTW